MSRLGSLALRSWLPKLIIRLLKPASSDLTRSNECVSSKGKSDRHESSSTPEAVAVVWDEESKIDDDKASITSPKTLPRRVRKRRFSIFSKVCVHHRAPIPGRGTQSNSVR